MIDVTEQTVKFATFFPFGLALIVALSLFAPMVVAADSSSQLFYQTITGMGVWTFGYVLANTKQTTWCLNKWSALFLLFLCLAFFVTLLQHRFTEYWLAQLIIAGVFFLTVQHFLARAPLRALRFCAGGAVCVITIELLIVCGQLVAVIPDGNNPVKAAGTLDNASGAAFAALLAFCLLFPLRSKASTKSVQGTVWGLLALSASVIVLLQSRAALLGLVGVVLSSCSKETVRFAHRPWLGKVSLLFLLLLIFFIGLLFLKRDSAEGRLLIYRNTLELVKESPLIGLGHDGFSARYMEVQAEYFCRHPDSTFARLADNVSQPMSDALRYMVEYGLTGVALLLLLYFVALRKAHTVRGHPLADICVAVLSGFGVASLFSYPLTYPFAQFAVLTALGGALASRPSNTQKAPCAFAGHKAFRYLTPFFMLVLTGGALVIALRMWQAESAWAKAGRQHEQGQARSALNEYARLLPRLHNHPAFLYNYAVVENEAGDPQRSNELLASYRRYGRNSDCVLLQADNAAMLGRYDQARAYYQEASFMKPVLFYPMFRIMQLNILQGDYDAALRMAKQIVEKPVKIPSQQVDLMKRDAEKLLRAR